MRSHTYFIFTTNFKKIDPFFFVVVTVSREEQLSRESIKRNEAAFFKPVASQLSVFKPVASYGKTDIKKNEYRPLVPKHSVSVHKTEKSPSALYDKRNNMIHRAQKIIAKVPITVPRSEESIETKKPSATPSYIVEGEVVSYQNSKVAGKPWVDAMIVDIYNDVTDADGQPYLLVRHDDEDGVPHDVNTTVSRVCEWKV